MPALSGLDLIHRLQDERVATPVILITGHGDVDMAVAAIKIGAFDFIEKPFDEARLLASIRNAVAKGRQPEIDSAELKKLRARFDTLSLRQRQVMELAAAGLSNKEIGSKLQISPKTVQNHRAWVMERTGARNIAELVRIAMKMQAKS
jgi:FixJ family two-component response regulator